MISCHGLAYRQEKTITMLDSIPEENPVSFQLFGADPDVMAQLNRKFDGDNYSQRVHLLNEELNKSRLL